VPETTNKPVVKPIDADAIPPDGSVVVEGNEPTTGPDTTSKPVVKAVGEKPTNEGDTGDESSASSEPLSLSASDDLSSGDESQEVKSVSGSSTTTETSEDEAKDPSYPEAPRLANIISQSQTTVPPAVQGDPPLACSIQDERDKILVVQFGEAIFSPQNRSFRVSPLSISGTSGAHTPLPAYQYNGEAVRRIFC
jgi:hypothetical protein